VTVTVTMIIMVPKCHGIKVKISYTPAQHLCPKLCQYSLSKFCRTQNSNMVKVFSNIYLVAACTKFLCHEGHKIRRTPSRRDVSKPCLAVL
jgi:hypothetical protein